MEHRGTIKDVTEWAERSLPGNESQARSAIVTVRKGGLFSYGKNGPRGRGAAFMMVTDFATALLAILHDGAATKSDEIVPRLWELPLALIEIDDPELVGPVNNDPHDWDGEIAQPYLNKFNLKLGLYGSTYRDSLLGVLTQLFSRFAPYKDFHRADHIILKTCGDKTAVDIVLHGGFRIMDTGWPGAGPDHSQVTLTFGDLAVFNPRAITTTRTIWADALNELSLMTPNLKKTGGAD